MEEQRKPVPEILWGSDGNGNALWFENEFAILFGRTNTGKSLYAVQIAEHISGRLGKTVLYLDLELSMKQFQERYTSKDGELHGWPETLHHPDLSMVGDSLYDSDKFLPLIRRMMARVNAKVLILDNLTFLVNNGGMKAEIEALQWKGYNLYIWEWWKEFKSGVDDYVKDSSVYDVICKI